jgi:hypothetical protein
MTRTRSAGGRCACRRFVPELCLGDTVGYGADPNACVDFIRAEAKHAVRGNHDKACAGLDDLEWFNAAARASALWTQDNLTPDNLNWLREQAKGPIVLEGFQIARLPLDEDEYLLQAQDAQQLIGTRHGNLPATRISGRFTLHRNGVFRIPAPRDAEFIDRAGARIALPDQPALSAAA